MSRHPQLSRQQMTDLLDHAFDELEELDKLIQGIETLHYPEYMISKIRPRIKALIERLSEYK